MEKLPSVTECVICSKTLTDPRILSCIHTFCLKCLEETGSKSGKKPGETIPCPVCGKEFAIPKEGYEKIRKNIFAENLIEVGKISESSAEKKNVSCDVCKSLNVDATAAAPPAEAKMHCVECQENLCSECERRHGVMKVTRDHRVVEIGSKLNETEFKRMFKTSTCDEHPTKILDYYCADCKRVVCVSCALGNHRSHKTSEIGEISENYRLKIGNDIDVISECVRRSSDLTEQMKAKRDEYLKEMSRNEAAILKRSEELKEMVDRHAKSLLDELNAMKRTKLDEMEDEKSKTEKHLYVLKTFQIYCGELTRKGSPGDVCRSVDEIHARTNELKERNDSFRVRSVPFTVFKPFHLEEYLKEAKNNNNCVGLIDVSEMEETLIVVGLCDGETTTKDVVRLSLNRPNSVSSMIPIPTEKMQTEAVCSVHRDALYVTGIGQKSNEIWKYESTSRWTRCGSLMQGRNAFCAVFLADSLYVCGGYVGSIDDTLNSVEAYSASTNRSKSVGQLVHDVYGAASVECSDCVYVFGGINGKNSVLDCVQVYNTIQNNCTLLSKPMPRPEGLMRAALSDRRVILFGCDACYVLNLETKTWQKRNRFKTDTEHFGLILHDEKIYVVGGGSSKTDEREEEDEGGATWKCRDDVRYVPVTNVLEDQTIEWKVHARLPRASMIHAYAGMKFPVE